MNSKVKRIKKQLERAGGIVYLPKDLRDEVAELFLKEIENCPDCQRALAATSPKHGKGEH
jgi:hypothetical protein